MTPSTLRDVLADIPAPVVTVDADLLRAAEASARYLDSDAAEASLATDAYWPKWDSPWWHAMALFELGRADLISARFTRGVVAALERLPLKSFPIRESDMPPGTNWFDHAACHCQLGTIARLLPAAGVDVGQALPWVEPWFARYQMADGGLNCDGDAYLADEVASSMVATVHPLAAMLEGEPAGWSLERRQFVDRAAAFLTARRLVDGSPSRHNAEEAATAPTWRQLCLPRFYFYDVLAGLSALVRWAVLTGGVLEMTAIEPAVAHLVGEAPDGAVRRGRDPTAGQRTRLRAPDGTTQRVPATRFALLDALTLGAEPSPHLTQEWTAARRGLIALVDQGQVA